MPRHLFVLVVLVVVAGCGGGGGGSAPPQPPLTGTATAAELDGQTQRETGFTESDRVERSLNTTVSAVIQGDVELRATRQANVTTVSVSYRRDAAVFGTYSVPAVKPFERADLTKNPVGVGDETLATRAQRTYTLSDLTESRTTTVTLLGNETALTRYEGTATRDGQAVTVVVAVATVRHGDDYVTAVTVAPADTSVPTETLMRGVMH